MVCNFIFAPYGRWNELLGSTKSPISDRASATTTPTAWLLAHRYRREGGFPVDKKVSLPVPQSWVDSLGASVSIGCAIQCILFPLLIGVLPLVGLGFLAGDGAEKVFLGTSIILALVSFSWGFRHHKKLYVFLFLVGGLLLIFTGRIWVGENSEISFVVSGTLALAAGHLLNRRLCQLCAVYKASKRNQAG
jgi:hypothetical protein